MTVSICKFEASTPKSSAITGTQGQEHSRVANTFDRISQHLSRVDEHDRVFLQTALVP